MSDKFGEFELDGAKSLLYRQEEPVDLALKAVEILVLLAENAGKVVTKEQISDRVWKNVECPIFCAVG